MTVCTWCRTTSPRTVVDPSGDVDRFGLAVLRCGQCDTVLLRTPRNWAPPKRGNRQAWKRIAAGEFLWDRRRVARSYRRRKHSARDDDNARGRNGRLLARNLTRTGRPVDRPDVGRAPADWMGRR